MSTSFPSNSQILFEFAWASCPLPAFQISLTLGNLDATHLLKDFAAGSLLSNIKLYVPDSEIINSFYRIVR